MGNRQPKAPLNEESESGIADVEERNSSFVAEESEPPPSTTQLQALTHAHFHASSSGPAAPVFTRPPSIRRPQRPDGSPSPEKVQKSSGKPTSQESVHASDQLYVATGGLPKLEPFEGSSPVFHNSSEPHGYPTELTTNHHNAAAYIPHAVSSGACVNAGQGCIKAFHQNSGEIQSAYVTTTEPIPMPGTQHPHIHVYERQCSSLPSSFSSSSPRIVSLETQLVSKILSEQDYEKRLQETTEEKEHFEWKLKVTQEELKRKDAETEKLRGEIEIQKEKVETLRRQIAEKEKDNETLRQENKELKIQYEREIEVLTKQITALTEREAKTKDEVMKLKDEKHELEKKILRMEANEERMKRELAEERQAKAELKAQLADIRHKQEERRRRESEAELQKYKGLVEHLQSRQLKDLTDKPDTS